MYFSFLGTSGALPSLRRDSTSIVFAGRDDAVLIDCGGSPLQKLLLAAVDPGRLSLVIITHLHADHAYGLPSLVQSLLLLRRTEPLRLACREEHAESVHALLTVFRLRGRPGMFPLVIEPVPARPESPVAGTSSFAISASPTEHGDMPSLALRVAPRGGAGTVVYSSDTAFCPAVVDLARGAHTLIHEATYSDRATARPGAHSTAAEAGMAAAAAGVTRLILTHIDAAHHDEVDAMAADARARFSGEVEVAEELVPYPL